PGDDVPVVRLSALGALNGEAPWEKKIDELMESVDKYVPLPQRDVDKPFLMPIEDIFSISGRGTVVTGRIERGKIKVGEEVEIGLPGDAKEGGKGRRDVKEATGRRSGGRQRWPAAARHRQGRG